MSRSLTVSRSISCSARHAVDKRGRDWSNKAKPSAGYIAWQLWGGDAGRDWINDLRARLREAQG